MTIITESPGWYIILCLAAGLVYAGALYFRDRFNRNYGSQLAALLGTLRFLAITILAFFILRPIIKSTNKRVEKPVVVICQDNSQSIVLNKDSAYYQGVYRQDLSALINSFGDQYDVVSYSFGDAVDPLQDTLSFDNRMTDFSGLLDELYNRYSGTNLGGVVIASDGLFNKGASPLGSFKKLKVPVYTIALGDTTERKDALIAEVASNKLAYLGNKFPLSITVEALKSQGEQVQVNVRHNGQTLYTESFGIMQDRFQKTLSLAFDAKQVGIQKYTVEISRLKDEVTYLNNTKDVFIDVLDARQKVLILGYAPHPDISALREGIIKNENYAVDVSLSKDFNGNLKDYSLIIFHQLPAYGNEGVSIAKNALNLAIPSVFVWGASTDYRAFNDLRTGYTLSNYRNSTTDVSAYIADGFSLFNLDEQWGDMLRRMPPLSIPFGELTASVGSVDFLAQQVGQIKTKKPLVSFGKSAEGKTALIGGEGIWRWRFAVYQQYADHRLFDELMMKIVQYMAAKEDKSLFRVNTKNSYSELDQISFFAELYNQSYEPLRDREIQLLIKNERSEEFNFMFTPSESGYKLLVGQLPVGSYTYSSTVNVDGRVQKQQGEFVVKPVQLESVRTVADHRLMYQLAAENNGEMVYPSQMNILSDMLKARKDLVSISYEDKKLDDLINYRWLLLPILLLLSIEWLLRKRAGTY